MATFSGTQARCRVCGETVYVMEQLTADGLIYHRACFRCSHCKGTLSLNSFASLEGVLYCKPHFDQLFKKTGSYEKSFEDAIKSEKDKLPPTDSTAAGIATKAKEEKAKPVNPLAARFGGTQDKCKVCVKTVYPLEKVSVENTTYHKFCFKCVHGGCKLETANYRALHGKLYCKHHFTQLFKKTGNYSAFSENGAGAVSGLVDGPPTPTPVAIPTPVAVSAPTTPSTAASSMFRGLPAVAKPSASTPAPSAPSTVAVKPVAAPGKPVAAPSKPTPAPAPAPAPTPAPAPAPPKPAVSAPAPAKVEPPKAAPTVKKVDDDDDSDDDSDDDDDDDDD